MIDVRTGDCRKLLREIPDASVHCVVTSPPYVGQREYGVDGQIGQEPTIAAFVDVMVKVFREVKRVLRPDGTLWMNLGHKYNQSGGAGGDYNADGLRDGQAKYGGFHDPAYKAKDCLPLAWFVGPALMADGWWLRSDVIWAKPNPMPSSVTDRPATAHEYVLLLTKAQRYFYDADATREGVSGNAHAQGNGIGLKVAPAGSGIRHNESFSEATRNATRADLPKSRNRRSVWTIPTAPFPGEHYATYPPALVEPCIKAGTSERGVCPECGAPWTRTTETDSWTTRPNSDGIRGHSPSANRYLGQAQRGSRMSATTTTGWRATCDHDAEPIPATVLDPFSGAGTTGLVAQRLGRDYIGLELNPEYVEMSRKRIADDLLTEADERMAEGQAALFDMAELRA